MKGKTKKMREKLIELLNFDEWEDRYDDVVGSYLHKETAEKALAAIRQKEEECEAAANVQYSILMILTLLKIIVSASILTRFLDASK